MRQTLALLIALAGILAAHPASALESGITCDIADDAVQPDVMKELERILKQLRQATS
jgi:hypothetical protein